MTNEIAAIIKGEFDLNLPEAQAETLRAAAWVAVDAFPQCKASDFGDAAATLGYHRQGATNRFREAIKSLNELKAFDKEHGHGQ